MELEKSKSGLLTLKYNGKYLHSKYDPVREAEQFSKGNIELIQKDIVVLYGIGLGYHVIEIVKSMKEDAVLYIFEWNKELIKCCEEVNSEIFKYKNVKIINSNNKFFYNEFSDCIKKAGNMLIHKPSLETIQGLNESLYNLINDFSLTKQFYNIDVVYEKLQQENFIENTKKNYPNIKEIFNLLKGNNKPFVIAAAGPSLDYEIESLKEYRSEFNIICVGSALRPLMSKGIKPDAIVIIDGKEIVKKQFEGFENKDIPLCFKATASRWAVDFYNGPKYIFNASDEDEYTLEIRGTVAVPAIDIAIKSAAKEIILLGQDLAFIGDRSHTESFEKTYGFKDDVKHKVRTKTVKSVTGEMLNTTQGFITFKNKIESLIGSSTNIQFINCSYGADIKGTIHMNLKDYIKTIRFK